MSALDSICTGSMMEAAALIQAKELSPVALTEAMLARIDAIDGRLKREVEEYDAAQPS